MKILAALLSVLVLAAAGRAQIQPAPSPASLIFQTSGTTDEPFTVQIVDARRAAGDTLILRLSLRNDGSGPLSPRYDFAPATNPADLNKIAGLYFIDPNGSKRFAVLRDANGGALCSAVLPPLAPGEQRLLTARFASPPVTSSVITVFFPRASQPIFGVPIGLPTAGEAIAENVPIEPPNGNLNPPPVSASTPPLNAEPRTNYRPDVHPNEIPSSANDAPGSARSPAPGTRRAAGHVQAANSDVPFTVEVLRLSRLAGGLLELRIALTNNSSEPFDVTDHFTAGVGDIDASRRISGVYAIDPKTKARATVQRDLAGRPDCSEIDTPLAPGERRELTARLGPALPRGTGSVYVYFPHASPIADVPIGQ